MRVAAEIKPVGKFFAAGLEARTDEVASAISEEAGKPKADGFAKCVELFVAETHDFESRYIDGLIGPLPEAIDLYRTRAPVNVAAKYLPYFKPGKELRERINSP